MLDGTLSYPDDDPDGLPFTQSVEALPHCARAIRARGKKAEAFYADALEIKYYLKRGQLEEGLDMARRCLEKYPTRGYFYYVLAFSSKDKKEGMRYARRGLKLQGTGRT